MSFVHWIVRDVPERFVEYLLSPENLRAIWDELQTRLQEVRTDELEIMSRQEFEQALVEFTASKLDRDISNELPRV